jgi:hypothetical protein
VASSTVLHNALARSRQQKINKGNKCEAKGVLDAMKNPAEAVTPQKLAGEDAECH